MFQRASKKIIKELDGNQTLNPVNSCTESFEMLELVREEKSWWPFSRTKYFQTGFTLNDVLKGDKPILPDVDTKELPKLNGITSIEAELTGGAVFPEALVEAAGSVKGTSQSVMCMNSLKSQGLQMGKLHDDCKDRVLDMTHDLIKQAQKGKKTLVVVTQRIVLAQTCAIAEKGAFSAGDKLKTTIIELFKLTAKVSTASDWELDIPQNTTMAFSCNELLIQPDGSFELNYMDLVMVQIGTILHSGTLGYPWLKNEVNSLSSHFALLCGLQASTRAALLQHLISAMKEGGAIYLLERVLSKMRQGERPTLDIVEVDSQRRIIQAILDVLAKTEDPSLLVALHLFVSALDEMSNECVADLVSSCTPPAMRCLERLMQCLMDGEEISLSDGDLAPLSEEAESRPGRLFSSCDVRLRKDGEVLRPEFSSEPNEPLLCLCIAVKSLAPLVQW